MRPPYYYLAANHTNLEFLPSCLNNWFTFPARIEFKIFVTVSKAQQVSLAPKYLVDVQYNTIPSHTGCVGAKQGYFLKWSSGWI